MAEKKNTEPQLTPEEKKAKIKEKVQGALVAIGFCLIFILAFAFYGMQSSLFGG